MFGQPRIVGNEQGLDGAFMIRREDPGETMTNTLIESTITRLSAQFPLVSAEVIEATVEMCRADLSGTPPGALPELVERLASWRLSEGVSTARKG